MSEKYINPYKIDITKPPIPPPKRLVNSFGRETGESRNKRKSWNIYIELYGEEINRGRNMSKEKTEDRPVPGQVKRINGVQKIFLGDGWCNYGDSPEVITLREVVKMAHRKLNLKDPDISEFVLSGFVEAALKIFYGEEEFKRLDEAMKKEIEDGK